jgi:DNA-binding CsgD family transcriptional regulator/PAS domain-containing protein
MAHRPGVTITTPMLPGEDELSHTDFWRQVVIANEAQQFLGQLVLLDDSQVSHVSIYRWKRERPFDADDERRLRDMAPHLQRAAQLRLRLAALEGQRGAAMEVLDRLPFGVVLVDAGARAVHVNRSAREVLGQGDGLGLSRGRLEASSSSERTSLRRLVGQAVEAGAGRGVSSGGALSVSRPSGLRPYGVLVSPLHGSALGSGAATACAIVLVSDPEQAEQGRTIALRDLYGLTAMESVIALSVVQGDNLKEVAESLGVSHNTARSHLAHVLLKTGARRQSDLVRLLLRGPLAIELK